MTNNNIALDLTDIPTRNKVILVTAISGMTIEIRTGMKVSRGESPLGIAKRLGFTGRSRKQALPFLIQKMQELDPEYTPGKTTQIVLDSL